MRTYAKKPLRLIPELARLYPPPADVYARIEHILAEDNAGYRDLAEKLLDRDGEVDNEK